VDLTVDVTGRGEPLVLIHGLATTGSIWRHAAPRLARSRQVFVLDVPGFGASEPVGRGFDLEAVADRVHAGLGAAGVPQPFDLVGHSMGAAVALTLAARQRGAVRGLVLVSPAGLRPVPFALAAALGIAAELYIPLRRIASPLADWSWGRRLLMTGGVVDGATLTPAEVRQLVGASRGARRIGPALTAVACADLRGLLRDLPVPVGAVWGTADRVVPPGGLDTVRDLRPDAACEAVDGAGHIAMVEHPDAFVAALERVLVTIR
jgi:pimeloyl-ACP methyl ester carboxylesterase